LEEVVGMYFTFALNHLVLKSSPSNDIADTKQCSVKYGHYSWRFTHAVTADENGFSIEGKHFLFYHEKHFKHRLENHKSIMIESTGKRIKPLKR
jgi:glyceraldehyde 3-phosphate dehydrogenase